MLNSFVLAAILVAAATPAESVADAPSATRSEYEALKAKTGPGADDQVRLALWCEEHGLTAEKTKHLARAVASDPGNGLARGLSGLVEHKGRWLVPADVAAAVKHDGNEAAALAEYNTRRNQLDQRTADEKARIGSSRSAAAHAYAVRVVRILALERLKLGLWCEQSGLKPEATAEFTGAVLLDPHFDDAWKRLDYVRHDGRWMPRAQAVAAVADEKAQRLADRRWDPLLRKWKSWLKDQTHQAEAEKRLAEVTDPYAVASVGRVLCDAVAENQVWAIRILDGIKTPASTRLVAKLAVFSVFDVVRLSAIDLLAHRPASDYADTLVEMIHTPAQYVIEPVKGPGSKGMLVVDTPRFNLVRSYDAPAPFKLSAGFYGYVGYDANGLPVAARGRELNDMEKKLERGTAASVREARAELAEIEQRTAEMIASANLKAAVAQQQLADDVYELETSNAQVAQVNPWVTDVLRGALAAPDLKDDEVAWHRWWFDRVGYSYTPPQKVYLRQSLSTLPAPYLASCFAAGTTVNTFAGRRAIETLRPGDRILSQETTTGALGFQPILAVQHNPPGKTIRLTLDNGEVLIPSIYHRFWLAGKGWALARDLKPGAMLRALGSRVKVVAAEPDQVVPVFNLDVAVNHTFFVGAHDYLVHDNTIAGPTVKPFDLSSGASAAAR